MGSFIPKLHTHIRNPKLGSMYVEAANRRMAIPAELEEKLTQCREHIIVGPHMIGTCNVCGNQKDRGASLSCSHCIKLFAKELRLMKKYLTKPDVCEVCGRGNRPIVLDHCHIDGRPRQWCCNWCNQCISLFDNDAKKFLRHLELLEDRLS